MSKYNSSTTRAATGRSPLTAQRAPGTTTFEGAAGASRDVKTELYLLAVSNLGTDTFYETAGQRDDRYTHLVREAAVAHPVWTAQFLEWLRTDANMRSAAIVGAAEYVHGRLEHGGEQPLPRRDHDTDGTDSFAYSIAANRRVISSVLRRADEPGELVAYWTSRYGKALPKPVKRGVADAVQRLYTERALLKYDTASKGWRFGDIIDLIHPSPSAPWQGDLYRYALDRRHSRNNDIPAALTVAAANERLRQEAGTNAGVLLDPARLSEAGMTWEDTLSLAGDRVGKKELWEALIPSMGIMALARNLRNFDQAGVSDQVAAQVIARFTDPAQVAKSRMFPFRWLAAYRAAPSLRWAYPLEQALNASLDLVPALNGRTLILVDRSPSMFPGAFFSTPNKSDISLADQAAVFGAALAVRAADPTLVEFGGTSKVVDVRSGEGVLKLVEKFGQSDGTDIPSAVRRHFAGHDRVVIVTDEQTRPGWLPSNMQEYGGSGETLIDDLIPVSVPVYLWNMAGYKPGAMATGTNRHLLGGLTDRAFGMIPLLESGRKGMWPWETTE